MGRDAIPEPRNGNQGVRGSAVSRQSAQSPRWQVPLKGPELPKVDHGRIECARLVALRARSQHDHWSSENFTRKSWGCFSVSLEGIGQDSASSIASAGSSLRSGFVVIGCRLRLFGFRLLSRSCITRPKVAGRTECFAPWPRPHGPLVDLAIEVFISALLSSMAALSS